MNKIKLSLVAALLAGSSAFAIENTVVSGNANLFYNTDDIGTGSQNELFNRVNSDGQASLNLMVTTDLTKEIKAGARSTVVNTLGLENSLASGVWEGTAQTDWWIAEAWMTYTAGKTDFKIGRQTMDTPLIFTETWSVADNTFDAVMITNTDIENTTLVGAYIGQTNSVGVGGGYGSIVNVGANQTDGFVIDMGTYVAGAIVTPMEGITAQAWYYNVDPAGTAATNLAKQDAYWLDVEAVVGGLTLAGQYGGIMLNNTSATAKDTSAFGLKAGYQVTDAFDITAAYTSVESNTGSGTIVKNLTGNAQTPLYTEAWWQYGIVGKEGTDAFNITANLATDFAALSAFYTQADVAAANQDMTEFTASATKEFGPLAASLVYIWSDVEDQNIAAGKTTGDAYSSVQLYLTASF